MGSFVSSPDQADDFTLDEPLPEPLPKAEDIEVQYVDTRPDEEKNYEISTVDENGTKWTRDDKQKYGKNVRERISKMDYRIHQTERERDQAVRERQALEEHARGLASQVEELRGREKQWGDVAVSATRSQIDNQITAVKQEIAAMLQSAHPDVTKVVDAQERLGTLTAQRMQMQSYASAPRESAPAPSNVSAAQGPPQMPTYQSDRERWLAVNPWFGKELDKTQRLIAIEQKLVQNGVIMGSRAYWDAIEKAKGMIMTPANGKGPGVPAGSPLSQTRPIVTGSSAAAAPGSNGATTTGGRKVVQLTQDERRAAARMNVSEQEWALEKLKRQEKMRNA